MSAAVDSYASSLLPLGDCYANVASVTPSDTTDLANVTRAIYVGGAGDLEVIVGGTDVTFKAVPVGTVLRIRASRVKAGSTTATQILALW